MEGSKVRINEPVDITFVKARTTFFSLFRGFIFFYEAASSDTFFEQCLQPHGYLACKGNLSRRIIFPTHRVFNE